MVAWTWCDDFHLKEQLDDILGVLDRKVLEIQMKDNSAMFSVPLLKKRQRREIFSLDPPIVRSNML